MSVGGTDAVVRFLIDFPQVTGKLCLIKAVHVWREDWTTLTIYDVTYALSADPDQPATLSLTAPLSRVFLLGRWSFDQLTLIGVLYGVTNPVQFPYPEGIECPYTRLPFFIQHSNNNAAVTDYRVTVFFEYVKRTPQELAISVMRRGRGVSRRVP